MHVKMLSSKMFIFLFFFVSSICDVVIPMRFTRNQKIFIKLVCSEQCYYFKQPQFFFCNWTTALLDVEVDSPQMEKYEEIILKLKECKFRGDVFEKTTINLTRLLFEKNTNDKKFIHYYFINFLKSSINEC